MKSPVEADAVTIVPPVVVADLDGILNCFGPGIGKEGDVKPKRFGDFHELMVEVRGCGDVRKLRV
jgi:hypothetical protein